MMNRDTARAFREDFEAAMASLQEKYGVRVDLGKMYLYPDKVTAKIVVESTKASDLGSSPVARVEAPTFIPAEYAKVIGMECVANRGALHLKVVGYNPRAKRDHMKLEGENGRSYKASLNWVVSHLIPAHRAQLS